MSALPHMIGGQTAKEPLASSQSLHISTRELVTLGDLLAELPRDKQLAMLRTTAGHIAAFLNASIEKLPIQALVGVTQEFRAYLKQNRYKRNAANSYCNYAGALLRKARELGWVEDSSEIPKEWKAIASAMKVLHGAGGIINFAIARGKTPATFNDDDLSNWARMMLNQDKCYEYIRRLPHDFRRVLQNIGFADSVPGIFNNWKSVPPYFVPLRDFPPTLRQEVSDLLQWKQSAYVQTKRKKRLRPVSARNLQAAITRLYGFLTNVRPHLQPSAAATPDASVVRTLPDLVTFDSVSAFTEWWLNTRNRKGRSLVVKWGTLCAALKEHPKYKGIDFSWFDELMRGIPYEPESSRRERKERKYLPYETVSDIPRRIREKRKKATKLGSTEVARVVHDELLIQWLLLLPWRQRNIRECRIGLKSESANLFKAEIEQWDTVAKPVWVQERLRANPHEQFWQYHFREHETKNGREVRSILPRRLIPLLEEYLEHHRSLLIRGGDPRTVFMNEDGVRFSDHTMGTLVSKLTLRYAGRRVTPHIFRDIWAYWWLSAHPEDYLTVSKKLWHRNIQTTLRIYGCKFDESQADCRVEEWVEVASSR
jgi:integrase